MNITAPRPGYWRSHATGEEFTACTRPESCLGGNETDPIGQCDTGYTGILCADCQQGFSRAGQTCSECPDVVINILLFCALLLVVRCEALGGQQLPAAAQAMQASVRDSVQENFGDFGAGCVLASRSGRVVREGQGLVELLRSLGSSYERYVCVPRPPILGGSGLSFALLLLLLAVA